MRSPVDAGALASQHAQSAADPNVGDADAGTQRSEPTQVAIVWAIRQFKQCLKLVVLTGSIPAGKNTVADKLAERLIDRGETVVVADVDDVAGMVATPGAAEVGLWFAAHEAHGALVGQWMRSSVEYVVVVGVEFGASWRRSVIARCRRQGRPRLASLAF